MQFTLWLSAELTLKGEVKRGGQGKENGRFLSSVFKVSHSPHCRSSPTAHAQPHGGTASTWLMTECASLAMQITEESHSPWV